MCELIKKHDKSIKVGLIILIIILGLIYLRFFFQKGITYDEVFLVRKEVSQGINFEGKSKSGDIKLKVKGDYLKEENVVLEYQLPNNINKNYIVEFTFGELNHKYKIQILDDTEDTIFNGFYMDNSDLIYLFDEAGEMILPNTLFYYSNNKPEVLYDEKYQISPSNIINLATQRNLDTRGKYPPFYIAILLLIIITIDIKYPLFFFKLDTFLNVEDAKPSQLFLEAQKMSWIIVPIIILILLIVAIT